MFISNSSFSLDLLRPRGPLGTTLEFCSVMAGTSKVYFALCTAFIYPAWNKLSGICLHASLHPARSLCIRKSAFLREVRKRTVPSRWWEADLPLKERLRRLAHKRELQLLSRGRWKKKMQPENAFWLRARSIFNRWRNGEIFITSEILCF